MAGPRRITRAAAALFAAALAFGPVNAAGAQDNSDAQTPEGEMPAVEEAPAVAAPADTATISALVASYLDELAQLDLDDDGVPDIGDPDGDGLPNVLEGDPGERDITPGDPAAAAEVLRQIDAIGLDLITTLDEGSDLHGDCSGMAMSFDNDGNLVDWAVGVGSNEGGGGTGQLIDIHGEGEVGTRAFTQDNPFKVGDRVVYFGRLPTEGDGPAEHNWAIRTAGISLDSGGDPNEGGKNRNAGEVNLGAILHETLRPAGIFPVTGELTSENGLSCVADGWVEFQSANPLLTAPSAAAALIGGLGVAGLLFNARPARTWKVL